MKRATLASSVAACFCLTLAAPLLAAEPPAAGTVNQPACRCDERLQHQARGEVPERFARLRQSDGKDGYWLGGSGYGYGYPMGGYGYEYGAPMGVHPAATAMGYQNARPGYEVRILVASANILARHGQQQACETCSPRPAISTSSTWPICAAGKCRHGGRAGLAAAADRRRGAGHRQEYRRSGPTSCSAPTCATRRTTLSAASKTW